MSGTQPALLTLATVLTGALPARLPPPAVLARVPPCTAQVIYLVVVVGLSEMIIISRCTMLCRRTPSREALRRCGVRVALLLSKERPPPFVCCAGARVCPAHQQGEFDLQPKRPNQSVRHYAPVPSPFPVVSR